MIIRAAIMGATAAAAIAAPAWAGGARISVERLVGDCRHAQEVFAGRRGNTSRAMACTQTIIAIVNSYRLGVSVADINAGRDGTLMLGFCGEPLTRDAIAVFMLYAKSHVDDWHKSAEELALVAFAHAWPCGRNSRF